MTGGPISDRRLVSHEDGGVTFSARVGKTHGGSDETEDVPLSGTEFVRRWAMHILPKGYTKSRRFGGKIPPIHQFTCAWVLTPACTRIHALECDHRSSGESDECAVLLRRLYRDSSLSP